MPTIESWSCIFHDAQGNMVAAGKIGALEPAFFNVAVSFAGGKQAYVSEPIKGTLEDAQHHAEAIIERLVPGSKSDGWRKD